MSLTSIMLKILEKALRERMVNRLEANKLPMVEQHGFWRKRLINYISVLEEATNKSDRGKRAEVCYPDFQKASDFVNHRLLDQKMEAFGVDAKATG